MIDPAWFRRAALGTMRRGNLILEDKGVAFRAMVLARGIRESLGVCEDPAGLETACEALACEVGWDRAFIASLDMLPTDLEISSRSTFDRSEFADPQCLTRACESLTHAVAPVSLIAGAIACGGRLPAGEQLMEWMGGPLSGLRPFMNPLLDLGVFQRQRGGVFVLTEGGLYSEALEPWLAEVADLCRSHLTERRTSD